MLYRLEGAAGKSEERHAGYAFRGWAEAEGLIIKLKRIKEASASNYPAANCGNGCRRAVLPNGDRESDPPNSLSVLAKALLLNRGSPNFMHCPIASNSNLAANLYHLVVRQFEDVCDANKIRAIATEDLASCQRGMPLRPWRGMIVS